MLNLFSVSVIKTRTGRDSKQKSPHARAVKRKNLQQPAPFLGEEKERPAAAVFFELGIRWSYINSNNTAPFVIAGKKPPAFSSASLPVEDVDEGMAHYEDADWFPDLSWGKEEVLEQTIRMPKLNAELTLLWLP